jgi:hypothetical protein
MSKTVLYSQFITMRTTSRTRAIRKRKNRNLAAYLWKEFSCSRGNKIILMSCPLVVRKFVFITQTGIP